MDGQNMNLWKLADKQANHIGQMKTNKAKRRQIVLLCETLKKALKEGRNG